MTVTPEEARHVHVLTLLAGKRITPVQALKALGLTPRQVRRLQVGCGGRGRRAWARRRKCASFRFRVSTAAISPWRTTQRRASRSRR